MPQSNIENEITFSHLVTFLSKNFISIFIITLLISILSVLYAYSLPKVYQSTVKVISVLEGENQKLSATASLASKFGIGGLFGGESGVEKTIANELLRSRGFYAALVKERNLIQLLFESDEKEMSVNDAVTLFIEDNLQVEKDVVTGVITLSVNAGSPVLAKSLVDSIIDRANETLKKNAIHSAQENIVYLNNELLKNKIVELNASIYRLIEVQIQKAMMANTRKEYAFKIIDPAIVSDEDNHIEPNKKRLVLSGILVGIFLGLIFSLIKSALFPMRESSLSVAK